MVDIDERYELSLSFMWGIKPTQDGFKNKINMIAVTESVCMCYRACVTIIKNLTRASQYTELYWFKSIIDMHFSTASTRATRYSGLNGITQQVLVTQAAMKQAFSVSV